MGKRKEQDEETRSDGHRTKKVKSTAKSTQTENGTGPAAGSMFDGLRHLIQRATKHVSFRVPPPAEPVTTKKQEQDKSLIGPEKRRRKRQRHAEAGDIVQARHKTRSKETKGPWRLSAPVGGRMLDCEPVLCDGERY